MTACIIGWAHTRFGKLDEHDLESLIAQVAREALEDAGVAAADVDAVYLGVFNAGLSRQEFPSSLVLQAADDLRFKPVTRVENACATGSAAVHQAANFLEARKGRIALVVGAEKMTALPTNDVGNILLRASYVKEEENVEGGFAGIFGQITNAYFQRYGDQSDALASLAVKAHKNALGNPLAHMHKELSFDFCRNPSDKNPFVAGPLKRSDCSLVSDGAAALVIADLDTALAMKKAVALRALAHVNDFLPMSRRDMSFLDGAEKAWQQAFGQSRLTIDDLNLVETHDCFTIAELMEYEAMGLTPRGEGRIAVEEGWTRMDGRLPVNPSGGLKAKGHPIGATGVSMHAMAAMQVSGKAPGGMQVPGATIAGVFNMGGSAVAHYASILEVIR